LTSITVYFDYLMNICSPYHLNLTAVINLLRGSIGEIQIQFEVFCNIRCGVTESFIPWLRRCREPGVSINLMYKSSLIVTGRSMNHTDIKNEKLEDKYLFKHKLTIKPLF